MQIKNDVFITKIITIAFHRQPLHYVWTATRPLHNKYFRSRHVPLVQSLFLFWQAIRITKWSVTETTKVNYLLRYLHSKINNSYIITIIPMQFLPWWCIVVVAERLKTGNEIANREWTQAWLDRALCQGHWLS